MDLLEGIYTRRGIRQYTDQPVEREQLMEIIRAGTWAPSVLNNQPWRFVIIKGSAVRKELAKLTKYSFIIERASACIAVFIDKNTMYNEVKDHQAMGACMQNMLLATHGAGIRGRLARRNPKERKRRTHAPRSTGGDGNHGSDRHRASRSTKKDLSP
ncbi:MAG TPA: nitroreductase family protein [Nitrospirota bacterium]|nr:nitroreductase family protein [Nitrospirota bacterium]